MHISFAAVDIIRAIKKALSDGSFNVAKNLYSKNKESIKESFPSEYQEFEKIFSKSASSKKVVRKTESKQKKNISTQIVTKPKIKQQNVHYVEMLKHLKAGRPIPAYRIYDNYRPISKEDFINLCKKILKSGELKNTMNYEHATEGLKRIIGALEGGSNGENIFSGVVTGVSDHKAPRKTIEIHKINNPYPDIIFGEMNEPTEKVHIGWFSDYSKYKKTTLQQDYINSSADLVDLSDDIRYMDRDQRLDAIAERDLISRRKSYIQKSIGNMDLIAKEPFFARLDYEKLSNSHENKIVYISKINNIEDYPSQKNKVYYADWRAPIGDLFYKTSDALGKTRFSGDDIDVVLNGRIIVRNGKLIRLDANSKKSKNNNIGNDILQEKLSQSSGDKMNEVVETIQVEQNEIIRHTGNQDLVIQGSAGSGKTIIGVHRIAYLMYSESIRNDSVIFISPNENFSSYISDVLPELGENNMPIVTMSQIIRAILFSLIPESSLEDFSSFIEEYFDKGYDKDIALKYSDDFSYKFSQIVNNINYEEVSFNLRSVMDSPLNLISVQNRKNEASQVYSSLLGIGDFSDCNKYENSVFAAILWAKISNTTLKLRPEARDNYVLCSENDIDKAIAAQAQYDDLMKTVWRKAKKNEIETEKTGSGRHEIKVEYRYTEERIRKELETHDYELIGRTFSKMKKDYYSTDNHSNVLHIVVDEAQDYSPWHIYLLRTVFPNAHFTILGDENQNLNPYFMKSKLTDLLPDADYIGVKKAYRSSPEIIEYTNKILGENIRAVRESNNIPVTELSINDYRNISVETIAGSIKSITDNGLKNIAIICRDHKTKQFLIETTEKLSISSLDIKIYTTYEAKGLEFDAAIVVDTYKQNEKELLYTACTRAQHQLIIYKIANDHNSSTSLFGRISNFFNK